MYIHTYIYSCYFVFAHESSTGVRVGKLLPAYKKMTQPSHFLPLLRRITGNTLLVICFICLLKYLVPHGLCLSWAPRGRLPFVYLLSFIAYASHTPENMGMLYLLFDKFIPLRLMSFYFLTAILAGMLWKNAQKHNI